MSVGQYRALVTVDETQAMAAAGTMDCIRSRSCSMKGAFIIDFRLKMYERTVDKPS